MKQLKIDLSNIPTILMDLYNKSKNNIGIDNRLVDLRKEKEKIRGLLCQLF